MSDTPIRVGFWKSKGEPNLPMPQGNIRPWEGIQLFASTLRRMEERMVPTIYRGLSVCQICGKALPLSEFESHEFNWPGDLRHYVEYHNVKPPQEFIDYILRSARRPKTDCKLIGEQNMTRAKPKSFPPLSEITKATSKVAKRPQVGLNDLELLSLLQQEETGYALTTRDGKILCEDQHGDLNWTKIQPDVLRSVYVFDTLADALAFRPELGSPCYSGFAKSETVVIFFKIVHTAILPSPDLLKNELRRQALAKLSVQEKQALGFGNDEVE